MALHAAITGNEAETDVRDRHARTDGDAANAGVENVAPDCKGGKRTRPFSGVQT